MEDGSLRLGRDLNHGAHCRPQDFLETPSRPWSSACAVFTKCTTCQKNNPASLRKPLRYCKGLAPSSSQPQATASWNLGLDSLAVAQWSSRMIRASGPICHEDACARSRVQFPVEPFFMPIQRMTIESCHAQAAQSLVHRVLLIGLRAYVPLLLLIYLRASCTVHDRKSGMQFMTSLIGGRAAVYGAGRL